MKERSVNDWANDDVGRLSSRDVVPELLMAAVVAIERGCFGDGGGIYWNLCERQYGCWGQWPRRGDGQVSKMCSKKRVCATTGTGRNNSQFIVRSGKQKKKKETDGLSSTGKRG